MTFHLNKLESPVTQGCVVPSLVEVGQVVQEKKIFKVRFIFSLFRYLPVHGPSFEQQMLQDIFSRCIRRLG